jgi:protein-L-isoaspartate(D-aspartate) O-methyltransferase
VTRRRDPDAGRFDATSIGPVGIFPCVGGRNEEAAVRLEAALIELRRASWLAEMLFAELHRGEPSAAEMDRVWYWGPGFWLERTAKS